MHFKGCLFFFTQYSHRGEVNQEKSIFLKKLVNYRDVFLLVGNNEISHEVKTNRDISQIQFKIVTLPVITGQLSDIQTSVCVCVCV